MIRFEPGKTYYSKSFSDYDIAILVAIEKRTNRTVTATFRGETKKLRICRCYGIECIRPLGNYSMGPVIKADRPIEQINS
jgi:hypothetical protein